MNLEFTITSSQDAGWTVVAAAGELDMATAPRLQSAIQDTSPADPFVVVDLSQVSFMDSSAMRVLVDAHRSVADLGGQMRIVVATPRVQKVLELSGLTRIFLVYDSVGAATAEPKTP